MKTKVLHVIDNLQAGGAQTLLYGLCKKLDEEAVFYRLISLRGERLPATSYGESVKSKILNSVSMKSRFIGILQLPYALLRTRKIIQDYDINIVHAHLPFSQVFCALLRILTWKKKIVFLLTPYAAKHHIPWEYKFLFPVLRSFYDGAFSVLQDNDDIDQLFGEQKVHRIPFTSTIKPDESPEAMCGLLGSYPDYSKSAYRLLTISRVASNKFMESYEPLFDRITRLNDVSYLFVGDGDRFQEYRQRKIDRSWDNLILAGFREESAALYLSASIVVSVSFDTHISLASMNALSTGAIVVTYNRSPQSKPICVMDTGAPSNRRFISCSSPEVLCEVVCNMLSEGKLNRLANLYRHCNVDTLEEDQWSHYIRVYTSYLS